jgi:cardiolipin synthase
MDSKKVCKIILKTLGILILCFVQVFILIFMFKATKDEYVYLKVIFSICMFITNIYIFCKKDSAEYKVCWVVVVNILPVVGMWLFYAFGDVNFKKDTSKRIELIRKRSEDVLKTEKNVNNELVGINKEEYNVFNYISNTSGYPLYKNQSIEYFGNGKEAFDNIFEEIKKAQKYIFIEFFEIAKGKLLDECIDLLKERTQNGVEVIIVMDSLATSLKLSKDFENDMQKLGIKIYKFNNMGLSINTYLNYRNHRKSIVIDSKIAYTGGINLADEYSNIKEKYGYFKDYAVKIKGPAVKSFIVMFLRKVEEITKENVDYEKYIFKYEDFKPKGYILPFEDGPDNRKNPIENTYIKVVTCAKDYVYITSPYFSVKNAVLNSLLISARSGVDVRIIFPKIPDKKIINIVTKSYYKALLDAGVKVYEFSPGFIHAKLFVSDDDTAIVSNSNFDYRSFESNLEACTYLYKTGEELVIKRDIENILKDCDEIKIEDVDKRSFISKIVEKIVFIFSPMI